MRKVIEKEKKGRMEEKEKQKKARKKRLRGRFLRLNATMVAFTMRRNYLSSLGDWITFSGGMKEMPRAAASFTE